MFPRPQPAARLRCRRCRKPTRPENLIKGFGPDCAQLLGLTGKTTDVGQTGPDLFDQPEEEDHCDGHDHC